MSPHENLPRRQFLGNLAATAASASILAAVAPAAEPTSPAAGPKIKVGLVGCGGRGSWIANLFKQHGGYEFVATADYFADRADKTGNALGVPKSQRFSGLSGYQRVMASGAEAVVLETPPYFFPAHAAAAVAAGLHVFMAKPVAVDVPGTLRIGELGKTASRGNKVFFVDYQIPTDPHNLEVYRRIQQGGLGALQMVFSIGGTGNGFRDPPLTGRLEDRLTNLVWINDDALGCGYIGNFDIHIIDAMIWALGRRPVSAYAKGGRFRKEPHGDSFDTNMVTYSFEDGLAWNHHSAIGATHDWLKGALEGSIQGSNGAARLSYWGKSYLRGGPQDYKGGAVENLYQAGAQRNIAEFYENVHAGKCGNETARRSVDCTLTCILGREASRRGGLLTMDELLKENKPLAVDLRGLTA